MKKNTYSENQNETMGENSFMKTLLKKRLNQKGLTLIELLAVIVILAIIAAIAIPAISNLIATQRDKAVLADAQTIIAGAKLAVAAGDCTTVCTSAQLQPYVDGVTLGADDEVTAAGWTLEWAGFSAINTAALDVAGDDNTATEAEIIAALE